MKENSQYTDQEILLAEFIMKVASMERLLLKAKVFSEQDLIDEMKKVSSEVVNAMRNSSKSKETNATDATDTDQGAK
jgi:hypothetical protein